MGTRGTAASRGPRRAFRSSRQRGDEGFGLVEVIVSIVLVTIVLLGGSIGLNAIQNTSSQQSNLIEAGNLANKYEELFQADAYQNSGNVAPGTYKYSDTVGNTTFSTQVVFSLEDPSGTDTAPSTLCVSSDTSETGEIWGITATVTWPNMTGADPVVETTDIAPGKAGVNSLTDATVAAAIDGTSGSALTGETINFTIAATQVGDSGSTPALPNNGQTQYSTTDGCAVVDHLVANANYDYTITLAGNPGWVDSQELSDDTPEQPSVEMAVSAGEVTKLSDPLQLGQGQTETVSLQPVNYGCNIPQTTPSSIPASCDSSSFQPASNVPVSVGNPSITGGFYSFGLSGNTPSSMLLYPYSNGYSVWAGDNDEASPGWSSYGSNGEQDPVSISTTAEGSGSVSVPVYELAVHTTSPQPITAVEQSGAGISYTLSSTGSNLYSAGLPLGQYELESNGSPLSSNPYVWITPNGWITNSSASTTPSGTAQTGTVSD